MATGSGTGTAAAVPSASAFAGKVYTLSDYRRECRRKALDSGSQFWETDVPLDEEINNALIEIATETRCIEKKLTGNAVIDQDYVAFPGDMLTVDSVTIDDADSGDLDYDMLASRYEWKKHTGRAVFFYAGQMYIKPTPTETGVDNITWWMWYLPDNLVNPTDASPLPAQYQSLVIPYVLWQYFMEFGENSGLAAQWERRYKSGLQRMKLRVNKRTKVDAVISARFASQGTSAETSDW